MIERHFGLARMPFANTPDPSFVYSTSAFDEGLARLLFDVTRVRGGLSLVTGDVGCGKTMLAAALAEKLAGTPQEVSWLPTPRLTPAQLLRAVADAVGCEALPRAKHAMSIALGSHLRTAHQAGRRHVVLVDEAQLVTPLALEEIRLLTNFEDRQDKHVHLVLLGQPELRGRIAKLPQVAQRIGLRVHLSPMDAEEVAPYLTHRLRVAGANGRQVFQGDAIDRLAERSGGVPRVINTLATQAMFVAAARGDNMVSGALVDDVADDRE